MLLCQYYYSRPPPAISLTFFYNSNRHQLLSHYPPDSLYLFQYIRPLELPSQQPSAPDSIAAIKHGRKPVSVLLKQFSMAQGHSSNISFLCLPVQQKPTASCSWRKNSGRSHIRPFDWLLYLGAERIGAGLTDWRLDTADDFVWLSSRWPPSVWLTSADAFDLLICFQKRTPVWFVCGGNITQ